MIFSKEIKESPTLKLAETARLRKEQDLKVISLAIGEPDFDTPNYIIESTIKALKDGHTGYSTPQGLVELRESISIDYKEKYNADYCKEEVIIFPGAKGAIFAALASILLPEDEVIIISPYYVSYPPMIKLAEVESKIIDISLNEDLTLPIDKIKDSITPKTKCIILNYPNNPTGQLLSKEEVEKVVEIIKENNIYLISDEIYDQMVFSDDKFISFSSYKEIKDNLIVINGYSKTYAMTGFRIGYALGSTKIIRRMNLINQNTNTNTNTFVQHGCLSIYDNDDKHIKDYNKIIKNRVDYFHQEINNTKLFSGHKPKGTFYYFIDISKTNKDSISFSNYLIEEYGLVTTPGIAFGPKYDNYLRVSLATSMDTLKEALKILSSLII